MKTAVAGWSGAFRVCVLDSMCDNALSYEVSMPTLDETRRRFLAHFAGIGLGATLVPGIVWARMQDQGTQRVTLAMVTEALKLQGLDLPEADRQAMVSAANQNLTRYEDVRKIHIPLDVSPPFHFSALAPGID